MRSERVYRLLNSHQNPKRFELIRLTARAARLMHDGKNRTMGETVNLAMDRLSEAYEKTGRGSRGEN